MKFVKPHKFTPYAPDASERVFFSRIATGGITLKTEHWERAIPTIRGSGVIISKFKTNLKNHLLSEQKNCCAYCGFDIDDRLEFQRDHIADKARHTEFLLEPANLVLSCHGCNGFGGKSVYNTISRKNPVYSRCGFNIVHPYFDDYGTHIEFDRALVIGKTDKGVNTIKVFKLNSPQMTLRRKIWYKTEGRRALSDKFTDLFNSLIQKLSRR